MAVAAILKGRTVDSDAGHMGNIVTLGNFNEGDAFYVTGYSNEENNGMYKVTRVDGDSITVSPV